jgi:hypothetical protein
LVVRDPAERGGVRLRHAGEDDEHRRDDGDEDAELDPEHERGRRTPRHADHVAALDAGDVPHLLHVDEVGTATMMIAPVPPAGAT